MQYERPSKAELHGRQRRNAPAAVDNTYARGGQVCKRDTDIGFGLPPVKPLGRPS
jgi:hypothetical protein